MTTETAHNLPPFRLLGFSLNNFRQFESLDIDFHPELTVIVGDNGAGKTAILDAAVVGLRYFVDSMLEMPGSAGFKSTDIRIARAPDKTMFHALPVSIEGLLQSFQDALAWQRTLASERGRTTHKDAASLKQHASELLTLLRDYSDGRTDLTPTLPLVAYYGTARLWHTERISARRADNARSSAFRTDAYREALTPSANFRLLKEWMRAAQLEATSSRKAGRPVGYRIEPMLDAINRATTDVLEPATGWNDFRYDHYINDLVATHPTEGTMPVSVLSDGIRTTIALVADIAHRCARLNAHFGDSQTVQLDATPGIVLIDEIDMHLHPRWQQQILASLRRVFKRIQFIVTTHSPQVISTVAAESIRILTREDGAFVARRPDRQTQGTPSNDVLGVVMGVDAAPPIAIRQMLDAYRARIQDGTHEQAATDRAELEAHFGPKHPEILDLERLVRFRQALRQRAPGGSR